MSLVLGTLAAIGAARAAKKGGGGATYAFGCDILGAEPPDPPPPQPWWFAPYAVSVAGGLTAALVVTFLSRRR